MAHAEARKHEHPCTDAEFDQFMGAKLSATVHPNDMFIFLVVFFLLHKSIAVQTKERASTQALNTFTQVIHSRLHNR